MVVGLGIVTDDLDLLLDEPLARRGHEAGRAAEIILTVLVLVMPAGVHDHHVARAHDFAGGLFQVVIGDRFPLFFLDRDHDTGAEEMRQRNLIDERRALYHVSGGIDVRRIVHRGGDALRQHARLGVIVDALDLDVLEIRPVRGLIAEAMRQIVELQPHAVVIVLLEHHAANFRCSSAAVLTPWSSLLVMPSLTDARPALQGTRTNGQEDRARRALPVPRLRGLLEDHRRRCGPPYHRRCDLPPQ